MAGAFHGVSEYDKVINVGVSGPGVVNKALETCKDSDFEELCETIKKTASRLQEWSVRCQGGIQAADVPFGIIDLSLAPTPPSRQYR